MSAAETALQADTDQALAWARELRGSLADGEDGDIVRDLAGRMAAQIRAEFPGVNAGRIVMAAASAVNALNASLEEEGGGDGVEVDVLVSIASLAALELCEGEDTP